VDGLQVAYSYAICRCIARIFEIRHDEPIVKSWQFERIDRVCATEWGRLSASSPLGSQFPRSFTPLVSSHRRTLVPLHPRSLTPLHPRSQTPFGNARPETPFRVSFSLMSCTLCCVYNDNSRHYMISTIMTVVPARVFRSRNGVSMLAFPNGVWERGNNEVIEGTRRAKEQGI
jgi:hypothetical protein